MAEVKKCVQKVPGQANKERKLDSAPLSLSISAGQNRVDFTLPRSPVSEDELVLREFLGDSGNAEASDYIGDMGHTKIMRDDGNTKENVDDDCHDYLLKKKAAKCRGLLSQRSHLDGLDKHENHEKHENENENNNENHSIEYTTDIPEIYSSYDEAVIARLKMPPLAPYGLEGETILDMQTPRCSNTNLNWNSNSRPVTPKASTDNLIGGGAFGGGLDEHDGALPLPHYSILQHLITHPLPKLQVLGVATTDRYCYKYSKYEYVIYDNGDVLGLRRY